MQVDPIEEIAFLDYHDVTAELASAAQPGIAAAHELQSYGIRKDEELTSFLARVGAKPLASAAQVSGGWEDDRAADEIMEEIIVSRRSRRGSS